MNQHAARTSENGVLLRPASLEEAGLFYSELDAEQDKALGTVGHIRMDFGHNGKEFWHTWWPHNEDQLNTPEFKDELQTIVDALRTDGPLKDLTSMRSFCAQNGGAITRDGCSFGYVVETDRYRYCLRCTPSPGDYQGYLYCYDKQQELAHRVKLVGRVTYADDTKQEFADPQQYLRTIREELPYHAFRKQDLSTDQRWERLLNKLDGKELTPDSEPPVLCGSRRFRLEELALEHEINELDNRLTFYLLPNYDPEAVFGLRVAETDNDDFLTACAVYDLDTGEVCSSLSVFHDRGAEGELEYRYPLTVHEQMVLGKRMDAICAELTGMHLEDCRAHYLSEMQGPAAPQL